MLKKIGIAMLIIASLGIAATTNESKQIKFHKTFKESNQVNKNLSNEDKEIINIAINFANEYIQLKNPDEFDKWFAKAPITEKFRKEYFRKDKYIDLKEKELYALTSESPKEKLTPAEMEGSTFTVSNLGMFGVDVFTSIINQPNSAILSVGAIIEKPVVKNGQIVVGHTMQVTLACDHRTIDGATGAQFLQTLKAYIENPVTMLA